MTRFIIRIASAILALSFFIIAQTGLAIAQSGPPTIVSYQVQKVFKDGGQWLEFSWDTRNVDRVTLIEDGREMESRIQLRDGTFGWPAQMPGAFSISTDSGSFTLRAENQHGRVEATANYKNGTCYAWLSPPGTHWSRCRANGLIAANLSTAPAPAKASCAAIGTVTSSLNFVARVPNNPRSPAAGTTTHRLDTIWFRNLNSGDYRQARLSGRGQSRQFRLNNLRPGGSYEVTLGSVWRPDPRSTQFTCPTASGNHEIRLQRLHSHGFSDNS